MEASALTATVAAVRSNGHEFSSAIFDVASEGRNPNPARESALRNRGATSTGQEPRALDAKLHSFSAAVVDLGTYTATTMHSGVMFGAKQPAPATRTSARDELECSSAPQVEAVLHSDAVLHPRAPYTRSQARRRSTTDGTARINGHAHDDGSARTPRSSKECSYA